MVSSTPGVTVTAHATIHTKGSWVEIQPAVPFDVYFVSVLVGDTASAGNQTSTLLDIGFDPAGGTAYGVAIPNILAGAAPSAATSPRKFLCSVFIPAGSTIAARIQSLITVHTGKFGIALWGGTPSDDPFPVTGPVVAYGPDTSDSSAPVCAAAAANTEPAWVELTSSTTHPHKGLAISAQGEVSASGGSRLNVDIAIGAASSEVILIEDVLYVQTGGEAVSDQYPEGPFEIQVPEGSRLSMRIQASSTNRNDEASVAVYGWG